MSVTQKTYGWIGQSVPIQTAQNNSGIFSVQDVNDLVKSNRFYVAPFDVQYLVIAGGGGGGGSHNSGWQVQGGGGAGGYRSSVGTENTGGGLSTESVLTLEAGVEYAVSVGAGGSPTALGTDTSFHNITSDGGGFGGTNNVSAGSGGSSGGEASHNGDGHSNNAHANNSTATVGQGFKGGTGWYENFSNSYNSGGGGGGASAVGINASFSASGGEGGAGVTSNVTGSAVGRAGGGAGAGNVAGLGPIDGGGNARTNTQTERNGTDATGGGGAGISYDKTSYSAAGTGGSGTVILLYDDSRTCTANAGVGGTEVDRGDGLKYIQLSGTGNVTFS